MADDQSQRSTDHSQRSTDQSLLGGGRVYAGGQLRSKSPGGGARPIMGSQKKKKKKQKKKELRTAVTRQMVCEQPLQT
ncbi:hypothetical protein AMELA_G00140410 [Ameiurus melas]|uniref:Uncharacterized protein n=1 Tax=Ameiurus melas TaxID=219545 RepID=A0A7J6AKC0_AMEME|nr:hypothetical protein AMELA_G00140410 [Ameiurus melas]